MLLCRLVWFGWFVVFDENTEMESLEGWFFGRRSTAAGQLLEYRDAVLSFVRAEPLTVTVNRLLHRRQLAKVEW
ncbi:MAG: hypothetical protein ABSE96_19815 [Terracidiphilus sp.]